jgi:hypothetical protein
LSQLKAWSSNQKRRRKERREGGREEGKRKSKRKESQGDRLRIVPGVCFSQGIAWQRFGILAVESLRPGSEALPHLLLAVDLGQTASDLPFLSVEESARNPTQSCRKDYFRQRVKGSEVVLDEDRSI